MSENKVNETDFWQKRIKASEMTHVENHSVYNTDEIQFEKIWQIHQKIIKKVIPEGSTVLDVGCGYGRACQVFPPELYTGCDFSPDFIELAKKKFPNYNFLVASMEKLPFANKSFDFVIVLSVRLMIRRYQSEEEWLKYDAEIKRVGKNVLYLEYTDPLIFEVV